MIGRAAALCCGVLLSAAPASAMRMSTSVAVEAFSKDGTAVLLGLSSSGPEGGGTSSYLVVGGKSAPKSFAISNDLSNGATRRERISVADCKAAAEALASRLKADGFENVKVAPAACAKTREEVVGYPDRVPDRGEKAKTTVEDGRILIDDGELKGDLGAAEAGEELAVVVSKPRKLAVVIRGKFDDQDLVAVVRAKDGKLESLPVHAR